MKNRPYLLSLLLLAFLAIAVIARATSTSIVVDQKICTGSATGAGGTMTCDYPITTDRATWLEAKVGLSNLSAGHLANAGLIDCEYIVENKNGTVSAPPAIANTAGATIGVNPANNTSTTFVQAHAQAGDTAFGGTGGGTTPLTCAFTISGTNARLTVTNPGSSTADVTVWIRAFNFGSQ